MGKQVASLFSPPRHKKAVWKVSTGAACCFSLPPLLLSALIRLLSIVTASVLK